MKAKYNKPTTRTIQTNFAENILVSTSMKIHDDKESEFGKDDNTEDWLSPKKDYGPPTEF